MKLAEEFWTKVDKNGKPNLELGPCWEWTALKFKSGYGQTYYQGKTRRAHRLFWFFETGQWSALDICHKCDNPACVRFSHLYEGTHQENMVDRGRKGRSKGDIRDGERNTMAIFSSAQVLEIRDKYKGGLVRKVLALEYNCSYQAISDIVTRRRWRHI